MLQDTTNTLIIKATTSMDTLMVKGQKVLNNEMVDTVSAKIKREGIPDISEIISYDKIYWTILILIVTYFISRLTVAILDSFSERSSDYRLVLKRLVPIARLLIWLVSIYFIIEGVINPPLETLFTMLASIGLAIGFASQDILKNFFGGFMIILDRPFQVGDKIEIEGHYGEVLQIGLRSTRIVTGDDSVVSIPNGELMNKSVSNSNTGALDCQVVAEIYLESWVDLNKAKKIAERAAATSRYVFLNKPIVVITINDILKNQLLIKLRVKAYVLDIRYEFQFQSDMTEIIIKALQHEGIIAVPVKDEEN